MEALKLPEKFMMGTATSALQIEGGDRNNNWYRWCEEKHIKDDTHCLRATNHWNKYAEDVELMKELNLDTYRMGLEWSRIEPHEGAFDEKAISHYREEIELLLKNGIRPLVTLHHFSHPLWLEDQGGWENQRTVDYFSRYTKYVVENIGDLVTDWITINEPNVFLLEGYIDGIWPPGKSNILLMLKAMKNMIKAHIKAYKVIHSTRKELNYSGETLVGVANHIRVFEPKDRKTINKFPAMLQDYSFHSLVIEGMTKGIFKPPIGLGNHPLGRGKFYDFIGINYYTRDILSFELNLSRMFGKTETREESQVNDLGWEIYPHGLYQVCKNYYEKYKAPVFITENGICDNNDEKRAMFIYEHLKEVSIAISEGVPIERYYHWTLVDNFEWLEGESARFGIVYNDYDTQERTIKKSGRFYQDICREKGISREMIEKYLL